MANVKAVQVAAPAKVNLYLHITGKRSDGYHELDSLVAFAGVGDKIKARPHSELSLKIKGPFAASLDETGENLVLTAARKLAELTGYEGGAKITLTKRLPVAAGIGGGSADAAATLRALSVLWGVSPSEDELQALALKLGADVPVCLKGIPVFMGGIGEQLTPSPPLPPTWLLLVNPRQALPTPTVFSARNGPLSPPGRFETSPVDVRALADVLRVRSSDLARAAETCLNSIGDVMWAIAGSEGCLLARMSGSGATCFGIFVNEIAAREAARLIANEHPSWWTAAAQLLSKPEEVEILS